MPPTRAKANTPPQNKPRAPGQTSVVALRQLADAAGRRVLSEFRPLLTDVSKLAPSRRGLAELLGVDRNAVQRAFEMLEAPGQTSNSHAIDVQTSEPAGQHTGGIDAVLLGPGPDALDTLLDACERAGAKVDLVRAAQAATRELRALIRAGGGSQAALRRTLRAEKTRAMNVKGRSGEGLAEYESRRKHFAASKGIVGSWAGARTVVQAVRQHPDNPGVLQLCAVYAQIGLMARPASMPTVLNVITTAPDSAGYVHTEGVDEQETLPGARLGLSSPIIPELSTPNLPTSIATVRSGLPLLLIDRKQDKPFGPATVALWSQGPEWTFPPETDPPIVNMLSTVRIPTRRLVHDVYLHRSLASLCTADTDAFLPRMGVVYSDSAEWMDRLPGEFRLQLLGTGLGKSSSDAWDRHADASSTLFQRAGWNAQEFVGYRLSVEYPVWSMNYRIVFDFTPMIRARG